jgi:GT2 family glycosyltransferase/glycosyltransferase involved in cell wall biosynthesis
MITIVVFGASEDCTAFSRTLATLRDQTYHNIEVLVAGSAVDIAPDIRHFEKLRGIASQPELGPLSFLATDRHDHLWRGSYLSFAPAGATFDLDCFELVNDTLNRKCGDPPDLVVIDHDHPSPNGPGLEPVFLPGWDPDLVGELDCIGTAFVTSRRLVTAQRPCQPLTIHDWLKGVAARLAQPAVVHVSEPVVHLTVAPPARPPFEAPPPRERAAPAGRPAMSVVIPNRNCPDLLKKCLGFLAFPLPFRLEVVIVDNESADPETLAIYGELERDQRARIVSAGPVFNYSRMINLGVEASRGEVVLLVNNDVEFSAGGQLEALLQHASRPEVGVVGCRLLYANGTVQHAGITLDAGTSGSHFIARHVLRGAGQDVDGWLFQGQVARNYQAVTGAVQAIRRDVFLSLGGYDEVLLPIEYNDIDFCLRAREAGLRVISLPLQGVYHLESESRGRESIPAVVAMRRESAAVMTARWPKALEHDPFSSPWVEVGDRSEPKLPWTDNDRVLEQAEDPSAKSASKWEGNPPTKIGEVKQRAEKKSERRRYVWRHPRKALLQALGLSAKRPPAAPEAPVVAEQRDVVLEPATTLGRRLQPGLTIVGYLQSEIGLGQAARNLVYAADNARLPITLRHQPLPGRENDLEFATKCNPTGDRLANLLVTGLPSILVQQTEIRPGELNILYPFWELGGIPDEWLDIARRFDEVWAPSRFIASAFPDHFGRAVRLLRQPVRLPGAMPSSRADRQGLRLFTFFDFDSYGARKNPQAAVAAFQAAFPARRRDVDLVIKVRGQNDRELRRWLSDVAAGDPRIKVIDCTLSRRELDELMAGCDAFVSLHRSEGFGLGAAEALAAGKAVVATDFGGTADFINAQTGYPVRYRLEPVQPGEYIGEQGQVWATASIDDAAAALRQIYDDPEDAVLRTQRGFEYLIKNHSNAAVGAAMADLLVQAGASTPIMKSGADRSACMEHDEKRCDPAVNDRQSLQHLD